MKAKYTIIIIIILSSLNNFTFITQTPFSIHGALASTITTEMATPTTTSHNATNTDSKNFSSSIMTLASGNAHGAATAVDPRSRTIYVTYLQTISNQTDLYIRKSTDAGKTFNDPVRVNDKKGDASVHDFFSPEVKISPDGKVYILWTKTEFSPQLEAAGFGLFGFSSLRFASSADEGVTFTKAANITDKNNLGASQIFGSFTLSLNGTIYVGWISQLSEESPTGSEVRVSKSTNRGSIFGPSIKVDSPANQCDNVNLASDSRNSVYVSWRKIFGVPKDVDPDQVVTIRDMVIAKSNNGGNSFMLPQKVNDDNFVTGQCITTGIAKASYI
jgi:hypothetical protein